MQALIAIVLIASASALLDLPPATISGLSIKNFEYYISGQESPDALTSILWGIQGPLEFNDQGYLQQISSEILMSIDLLENLPYHSLRWQFKVNKAVGVLRVIDIVARARPANGGRILMIVGKAVEIIQKTQYAGFLKMTPENLCRQGGSNLYFVKALGHTWDCFLVLGKRGLNGEEINQINQALIAKMPDAMKKLE